MDRPSLLRPIAAAALASSLGACSIEDDLSGQPRSGDEELVTLCHIPPGYPDGATTIIVSAADVADHLEDHADTLGPCPTACELQCDQLSEQVLTICEDLSMGLPVPEGFCEQAAIGVNTECDANCPAPAPEECDAFCVAISEAALESCFELIPDPMICHVGADITFQECVQVFECPPPPPTCEDECFFAFDEAIQQCELEGGDPACFMDAEMQVDDCFDGCCLSNCNADCESVCGGEQACVADCQSTCPQLCEPPAPGCFDECFFAFDQAIQQCDLLGGDPQCYFEAEQQLFTCESGCCVQDCSAQCPLQCGDDPECLAACQGDCELVCLPPPTCDPNVEQLCPDGACVPLGEPCPALCGPLEEYCPDGTCVPLGEPCPMLCDPMFEQECPDGLCVPLGEPCPMLCDPMFEQECPDGLCVPLGEPCPVLCDPMWEQQCPDGTCVLLGDACPTLCDPMFEQECPDGLCVPLGEPCPEPPLACEDQCGGDPMCITDCCTLGCMADDNACLDMCCLYGCEIGFPEDPLSCYEQQCIVP